VMLDELLKGRFLQPGFGPTAGEMNLGAGFSIKMLLNR
jgi:hypothetical protein